jgi:hypothetical protein
MFMLSMPPAAAVDEAVADTAVPRAMSMPDAAVPVDMFMAEEVAMAMVLLALIAMNADRCSQRGKVGWV